MTPGNMTLPKRIVWPPVIEKAAEIVREYDTGVTLRQLFYRLVAAQIIPNTEVKYQHLSRLTAEARSEGWFPALLDQSRGISLPVTWDGDGHALAWLRARYRRDRTECQPWTVVLGVEKHGIEQQLSAWFGDYGVPIVALGGYASQTLKDEVTGYCENQDRPTVLLYAGDYDPTGEDILRDFTGRVPFDEVQQVALSAAQVDIYGLPDALDAETLDKLLRDPRAAGFYERHGVLRQVELDALPPDTLRERYQEALDGYFDQNTFDDVLGIEAEERERI